MSEQTETTPVQSVNLVEVTELESWLDDELRCESPHSLSNLGRGDAGCTVLVTHVITGSCAGKSTRICQSRAEYKIAAMSGTETICGWCNRPASECWQIAPFG